MELLTFIFLIIVSFIIVHFIAKKEKAKKKRKIEQESLKRAEIEALEEAEEEDKRKVIEEKAKKAKKQEDQKKLKAKIYKITSIGSSAFSGCTSLKKVNIPDSVTTIKNNAFAYCSSLDYIYIPKSVTSIQYYAFKNCSSLKSIIIANSKENVKIGKNAFDNIEAVRFIGESNKEKKYSPILEETKKEIKQETKEKNNIKNNQKLKTLLYKKKSKENMIEYNTTSIKNYKNSINEWKAKNKIKENGKLKSLIEEHEKYIYQREIIIKTLSKELKEIENQIEFIQNPIITEYKTIKEIEDTQRNEQKLEETKEKNINYIYPTLKPLKEFSNKPIDLYSVQKAKIKAIKRGEKIENIRLFDMFGKLQEKVKV